MDISPADSTPRAEKRVFPRLKVLYLFAVTVAAFAVPAPYHYAVVACLLLLQAGLLLAYGVGPGEVLKCLARVRWLFLLLLVFYAFWPWQAGQWLKLAAGLSVNLDGLLEALLMCGRIATAILASTWVRVSGPGTELIEGLKRFGFPKLFCYSIDNTLALIGGLDPRPVGGGGRGGRAGGGGGGKGGGRGRQGAGGVTEANVPRDQIGFLAIVRRLVRGDVGFLISAVQANMDASAERLAASGDEAVRERRFLHDATIVSGIGLMMMTMKLLKIAPGVPFASGHKTLLLIPLYVLAAELTYSRFGATTAGSVMGVIAFLNGDSRYGIFEILKHVVPGLTIDLLWPIVSRLPQRRAPRIAAYCLLGLIAGLARTTTQFGIALAAGMKWQAMAAFAFSRLVPNLVAGPPSGFVTYFLLNAFRHLKPVHEAESETIPAAPGDGEPAQAVQAPASLGD